MPTIYIKMACRQTNPIQFSMQKKCIEIRSGVQKLIINTENFSEYNKKRKKRINERDQ